MNFYLEAFLAQFITQAANRVIVVNPEALAILPTLTDHSVKLVVHNFTGVFIVRYYPSCVNVAYVPDDQKASVEIEGSIEALLSLIFVGDKGKRSSNNDADRQWRVHGDAALMRSMQLFWQALFSSPSEMVRSLFGDLPAFIIQHIEQRVPDFKQLWQHNSKITNFDQSVDGERIIDQLQELKMAFDRLDARISAIEKHLNL